MRRLFVLFLSLVALTSVGFASPHLTVGQEATPQTVADQFPIIPDPAGCTGESTTVEAMLDLWYGPGGTPAAEASPVAAMFMTEVTIPIGAPAADEETTAAVIDTVEQVFSCFAAGDVLRAYALFSDDLSRQFGPEPGTTREEAEAFLTGAFDPEGEEEQSEIVAITDVMVLDDGRVGAFVVDRTSGEITTAYVAFEQVDGRWLVDQVIEFGIDNGDDDGEGTPTP